MVVPLMKCKIKFTFRSDKLGVNMTLQASNSVAFLGQHFKYTRPVWCIASPDLISAAKRGIIRFKH